MTPNIIKRDSGIRSGRLKPDAESWPRRTLLSMRGRKLQMPQPMAIRPA